MSQKFVVASFFVCICVFAGTFAGLAYETEEANLALVKWILERPDAAGDDVWSHVAESIELQILSASVDETTQLYTGKEAVEGYFDRLGEELSNLKDLPPLAEYEPIEYYADGDTVIVVKSESGTNVISGKPFVKHNIFIVTFADGKIVKVRIMGH